METGPYAGQHGGLRSITITSRGSEIEITEAHRSLLAMIARSPRTTQEIIRYSRREASEVHGLLGDLRLRGMAAQDRYGVWEEQA